MDITLNVTEGLSSDSDHFTCPNKRLLLLTDAYFNAGNLRGRFPSIGGINTSTLGTNIKVDFLTGWQDPSQIQTPTRYCVFAICNNKFWRANWLGDSSYETGSTSPFTDITNAVAVGSFPCTADTLNGNLVVCTNNSPPVVVTAYNGNISALGGSPPTGVCVKVVNNFMFIAGTFFGSTTSILSRVYWSAVSDPTTWPAASNIDFRLNDGDFVTALGCIGINLYIFKQNSIGVLNTTTQTVAGTATLGPLSTVATGIGCPSPCGVDNLPDGRIVFYGTDHNIYLFDGSTFTNISQQPYLSGPSLRNDIVTSYGTVASLSAGFPTVKVYPTTHEIWVFPYTQTSPTASRAFIYDYENNFWSSSMQFKIQSFALVGPSRNGPGIGYSFRAVYGGEGLQAGNVYLLENTTDAGTSISATQVLEWSIPLVNELANFVPRSVVIPASLTYASVIAQFGFDGVIQSTTYPLSTSIFRHVLPIQYPTGTNGVRFSTFQLKVSNFGSKDKFYPITVSDQVLS